MSGPVDVLAVLAELAEGTTLMTRAQCVRVSEARAAVAELIEKIDDLLSSHGVYSGYGGAGEAIEEYMRAELVTAVARVKGESQ